MQVEEQPAEGEEAGGEEVVLHPLRRIRPSLDLLPFKPKGIRASLDILPFKLKGIRSSLDPNTFIHSA